MAVTEQQGGEECPAIEIEDWQRARHGRDEDLEEYALQDCEMNMLTSRNKHDLR